MLRKRKYFGFCFDNPRQEVPIDETMFEYFQSCDESVVLCDTKHEVLLDTTIQHPACVEAVIHQPLPSQFQDVKWPDFIRFLKNQKPTNKCIDFEKWSQLLAYLGKDCIVLENYVQVYLEDLDHYEAFRFFGKKLISSKDRMLKSPRPAYVPLPEEVIELLDPKHTIAFGLSLVGKPSSLDRCISIWFFNTEHKMLRVNSFCDVLIRNGYEMRRTEKNKLVGLHSRFKSVSLHASNCMTLEEEMFKCSYIECQINLVSADEIWYSACFLQQFVNGIEKSNWKKATLVLVEPCVTYGLRLTPELQKFISKNWKPYELTAMTASCNLTTQKLFPASDFKLSLE